MRAAEFVTSLSRIGMKLESLDSTAIKLQTLMDWFVATHALEGALLLDQTGQELYTAGDLESTALDSQELFGYAEKLSADPAVVVPDSFGKKILKPVLDGIASFIHYPLSREDGDLLGNLLIVVKKPAEYLDSRQDEIFLVATKMRDLILINRFSGPGYVPPRMNSPAGTLMEESLEKETTNARQFISGMNFPMFLMSEKGELLAANSALLAKLRYAHFAQFAKQSDLFQDLRQRSEILKALEGEGGVRSRRVMLQTSTGEQVAMNLSLVVLGDAVVGALFDISEYVRVTDDLRESLKMQEFLNDKLISAALLLHKTQSSAIRSLARLAEFRDHETGDHLQRIREYSRLIAWEILHRQPFDFKIRSEYCDDIFLSSMLHDIGKVGIPDNILLKKGKLDDDEWKVMKNHTLIGWTILNQADCELGEQSFLTLASQIALNHHERWDGRGYPNGLEGDKIPLSARISAVADVYDALTSQRPYKKPWHHDDAIKEINSLSGAAFDPVIVDILMSVEKKMLDVHYRFPK